MRIQQVISGAAALTIAAPLIAFSTPNAGATPPASDMPRPKVQHCKGKDLRISLGKLDASLGSYYQNIRFRNPGKRCLIKGWPRVLYASKAGAPVGFRAKHRRHHHRVVLKHGAGAKVTLQTPNPENFPRKACHPRRAAAVKTFLPRHAHWANLNKLKRPMQVCTTKKGRPQLIRLRHIKSHS